MARRPTKEPMWNDVLSSESLGRMRHEAVIGADGKYSGYKVVFATGDPRRKSEEVRYATPKLHVSGGDTFLHGKLFNKTESPFKRTICVRTSRSFDKNPEWLAQHPEAAEDNEEYYPMLEDFIARNRDLAWEDEPVRLRLLKDAIFELRKKEMGKVLEGFRDKRELATLALIKSKNDLLVKGVKDLGIDKATDAKWRDKAAVHLATQKSITSNPKFIKALDKKMRQDYKDAALNAMAADPVYADNEEILENAREKLDDEFTTWVFYGKESDGDGEDLKPDDPPHGTHRYKMRPFYKPRNSRGASGDVRPFDWDNTTKVDVHPKIAERYGIDGRGVFELEEEARQQGQVVRRIKFLGKFDNPTKRNRLPDGSTLPWFNDPRQEMLRPGSIVVLIVSFFVYIEPHVGMRMHFDEFVRLYEQGPEYGRVVPEMDMDEATAIGGGGEGPEDGDVGVIEMPTQTGSRKRRRSDNNNDDDDDDDAVADGDEFTAVQGGEGDNDF